MKIVIDTLGGDGGYEPVVQGAVSALGKCNADIILTGDAEQLRAALSGAGYGGERVSVIHAPDIIQNDESPTQALREKKNSSIVAALNCLKDGAADAMITAGSTGAALAGGIFNVGRLEGIMRPALCPLLPTAAGKMAALIDCGANMDCKSEYLVQFAVMGISYIQSVYGMAEPVVGLLSVGAEKGKGNELTKKTFEALSAMDINFYGNIEARDVLSGKCDIIVCDGFDGNVLIKSIEGTAKLTASMLSQFLKANAPKEYDLSFVKKSFGELMANMDFNSNGGAPMLGLKGIILKAHGTANSSSIMNAVFQAETMIKGRLIENLKRNLTSYIKNEVV